MEALACGLPVLASDIPGNREWLARTQAGKLFPDGDGAALAAGILQIIDQPEELENMSQQARQLAEERANWAENFKRLLSAYQLAFEL